MRPTAGLLDDVVDRRKAETCAFAERFRREERLERVGTRGGIHADAGIGHGDRSARSRGGQPVSRHLIDRHVLRFDRQMPSRGHRVTCVDGKIEQHLLDLRRSALTVQRPRPRIVGLDVLAKQTPEQLLRFLNDVVQVEHSEQVAAPPAERKQLPDHPSGAFGGSLDRLGMRRGAVTRRAARRACARSLR